MYNYELQSVNINQDFDHSFIGIPKAFEHTEPISHGEFMSYYLKKIEEDEENLKLLLTIYLEVEQQQLNMRQKGRNFKM